VTTLWTCDSRRGGGEALVKHFSDDPVADRTLRIKIILFTCRGFFSNAKS